MELQNRYAVRLLPYELLGTTELKYLQLALGCALCPENLIRGARWGDRSRNQFLLPAVLFAFHVCLERVLSEAEIASVAEPEGRCLPLVLHR